MPKSLGKNPKNILNKISALQQARYPSTPAVSRTVESEPAVEEKRSDNDVATILMKTCDSNLDQIPLRSSTLTLSKYDEKMPRRSSAMTPSMRKLSHSVQAVARRNSFEEGPIQTKMSSSEPDKAFEFNKVRSPLSKGVLNIQSINLLESDCMLETDQEQSHTENPNVIMNALNAAEPEDVYVKDTSVLQDLVDRRRTLLSILVGIFIVLFVTGCVISAVGFSSTTSMAAKVIGLIMLGIGLIGSVSLISCILKPDNELQERIERREKLFATFREIVTEPLSTSKMKFDGAGDDKHGQEYYTS